MNLIDIFGGVTGGVSLYSPLFGEVQLYDVLNDMYENPILVQDKYGKIHSFTKEGYFYANYDGCEVMLFPSKDIRDWNEYTKNYDA